MSSSENCLTWRASSASLAFGSPALEEADSPAAAAPSAASARARQPNEKLWRQQDGIIALPPSKRGQKGWRRRFPGALSGFYVERRATVKSALALQHKL